jgi:hypothetical protein
MQGKIICEKIGEKTDKWKLWHAYVSFNGRATDDTGCAAVIGTKHFQKIYNI